ncbi:MAG: LacI family DNA-binding transcriptional regulator [Sphingomonas sp.]|nr:LacI family DNA-binding transcriptional regulator [Sphingomonas sp.]
MTVSRVINGEAKVRPATRDVVKDAIAELNYSPNSAARALAGAEQCRLGLLYSNPSAGYFSAFLLGGLDQARRHDAQLIVEHCDVADQGFDAARHLIQGGIDGILLPSPLNESRELRRLLIAEGIPTVLIGSGAPAPEMLAVDIDEGGAAYAMTKHIVSLGHRRIGFITGDPVHTASSLRLDGYKAALRDSRLPVDETLIASGLFTYRSGLDAAEQLIDREDAPTAIFASNDDMGAATVAVAHKLGLDVPGDLTVCGFDDTTLATVTWPELTTIHQPIDDMARAAIEMLVTTIRAGAGAGEREHRLLDFTLVRRQSDAPPRRRPAARPA